MSGAGDKHMHLYSRLQVMVRGVDQSIKMDYEASILIFEVVSASLIYCC